MTVTLRLATIDDVEILFQWRNDPVTRANSPNTEPVPWADHINWLKITLQRKDRKLLVAEIAGVLIGTVRFDYIEDAAEISWTIGPAQRGKGLGTHMLRQAIQQEASRLIAKIKPTNSKSLRMAKSCGFYFTGTYDDDGLAIWERAGTAP